MILPVLALLTACTDNGVQSDPPSTPISVNSAPVFTSPISASFAETASGVVYTATAMDVDGDPLVFSLAGTDAAIFSLVSDTGALSLVGPLDFEMPSDADADNDYEITVTVSDGQGASVSQDVTLTVTDVDEALTVTLAASSLGSVVQVVPIPDEDRLLVVEQAGTVRNLDLASGTVDAVPFLDVSSDVSGGGEQGLLGLALSPDFAADGVFYVNLTNSVGNTEIRRYATFGGSGDQADPATEDVILAISQPFSNHNAGWIGFSSDGFLLIPTGDGGSAGDPMDLAQDVDSLLGKVLRIDVSSDDFPSDPIRDYAIPPTNPFSATGGAPEIIAVGLRNPFRASLDPVTEDLYIGDVGQDLIEEINRFEPDGTLTNFGWNRREGAQAFAGGAAEPGDTEPVIDYEHGMGPFEGNSVVGGVVYRGPIGTLDGHYIYGDTISSNIWAVPLASLQDGASLRAGVGITRLTDVLVSESGTIDLITSFAVLEDGQLVITDLDGEVFLVSAAP